MFQSPPSSSWLSQFSPTFSSGFWPANIPGTAHQRRWATRPWRSSRPGSCGVGHGNPTENHHVFGENHMGLSENVGLIFPMK